MTIANKLAEIIAVANYNGKTFAELAKVTKVDAAILSRVAAGHNAPSLANAERIADGLGYRLELKKKINRPKRRLPGRY